MQAVSTFGNVVAKTVTLNKNVTFTTENLGEACFAYPSWNQTPVGVVGIYITLFDSNQLRNRCWGKINVLYSDVSNSISSMPNIQVLNVLCCLPRNQRSTISWLTIHRENFNLFSGCIVYIKILCYMQNGFNDKIHFNASLNEFTIRPLMIVYY